MIGRLESVCATYPGAVELEIKDLPLEMILYTTSIPNVPYLIMTGDNFTPLL